MYKNRIILSLSILGLLFSLSACELGHGDEVEEKKEDNTQEQENEENDKENKGDEENEDNNDEEEEQEEIVYTPDSSLLITEINTGLTLSNRAVEISNIGEETISLDNYSLDVYRSWSDVCTESIPLDGYSIDAHSSFVIAYSGAKEAIKNKAQLITDQYLNNGTFPVALSFHGKAFDAVGTIGYNYDFAESAVLVRLKEYFKQSLEFKEEEWVRYPVNSVDTLGNIDVIDEETLLDGPKLTQEDFDKPFCVDASNGSGGVLEVSLVYTSDGDTTRFNYGNEYAAYDVSGKQPTRYYGINTPEIAHSAGEVSDPYGDEAKDFTNNLLRNAKHYLVQSVNGYSLHETYGRMLGYVWITTVNNPKPEDYQLLNFLIIKNGFSRPAFIDRKAEYNSLMTYEGISYIEYLYTANTYAEINKLNIHSGE